MLHFRVGSNDYPKKVVNGAQYFKTFYGRNLQTFINRVTSNKFVPGKPFQPSLECLRVRP